MGFTDALLTWMFDNAVWLVAGLILAGALLLGWAKGYRIYVGRARCAYCRGEGRDPGYQAPRPCRVCGGKGRH